MIPAVILEQLASLRKRERLLQIVWGAARLITLVLLVVFLACLIDYIVDAFRETPTWLHVALLPTLFASIVAGSLFFFWPMLKPLSDDELTLWVEESTPRLHHRLISAVQFNRRGARVEGMSTELVGVVTHEAEHQAKAIPFQRAADHDRVKYSAFVLVPALLLLLAPLVFGGEIAATLLGRLFLIDMPIPRRVSIANSSDKVWPIGEKVTVKLTAKGSYDDEAGTLHVYHDDGQPRLAQMHDVFDLKYGGRDKDGDAIYTAEVVSSSSRIAFNGRIGDGRMSQEGEIKFVARPSVQDLQAWLVFPAEFDRKPNGMRYEKAQPRAEVRGPAGSSVRVKATLQKPVKSAKIELLGYDTPASKDKDAEAPARQGEPKLRRTLPMTILPPKDAKNEEEGSVAEALFEMRPDEGFYQIVAVDKYGFDNDSPPRRTLDLEKEGNPVVALLREEFLPEGPSDPEMVRDDFDLNTFPVPVGGPLIIAYSCAHPYGITKAKLWYRVLKKQESGEKGTEDVKWSYLELSETKDKDVPYETFGAFDPSRGCFEKSGPNHNVKFYAVPSPNPDELLGRTVAGGRFLFHTKNIVIDKDGSSGPPGVGDQIEYKIEAFAGNDASRPTGMSETRVKSVETKLRFVEIMRQSLREEIILKGIARKQGDLGDQLLEKQKKDTPRK